MKQIKLSGKYSVGENEYSDISECDYERCIEHLWFVEIQHYKWNKGKRYKRKIPYVAIKAKIKGKTVHLSRFIMGVGNEKIKVDHIDQNRLNNTRENLRLCNNQQSAGNTRSRTGSTSKYLGVHWNKSKKKWIAEITHNGKGIRLGSFDKEDEAGLAYNKAAFELRGEFAKLNKDENGNILQ